MTSRDTELEDWVLAQRGDCEAYERLYRANVGKIYALVVRMAGEYVAEDLTQEIFVRAWRKLGTFRGDSGFTTWLHRLAVNHVLSRRETLRRREARRATGNGVLERIEGTARRPGLAMDLERGIRSLPERARHVFVLFDVEGYGHQEIAEMLEISVGTSKSQLHRARMLLREGLA